MQTIIIINDIHGNFSALSAILNDVKSLNVDYYIFTGDLIGIGASGNKVIDQIKTIKNKIVVKGNHEDYLLNGFRNPNSAFENAHHDWIRNHISSENIAYLSTLKNVERIKCAGLLLHITHYPRYDNGKMINIIWTKKYEDLYPQFNDNEADLFIYGHNHFPEIIQGEKTLINIGAAGCSNINIGMTRYGILKINDKNYTLDIKTIPYDIKPERDLLDSLNVPDKEMIKDNFFKIRL